MAAALYDCSFFWIMVNVTNVLYACSSNIYVHEMSNNGYDFI